MGILSRRIGLRLGAAGGLQDRDEARKGVLTRNWSGDHKKPSGVGESQRQEDMASRAHGQSLGRRLRSRRVDVRHGYEVSA
jgi:hypothetical protein